VSSVWLPEVVGNPVGMRALAVELRGDATAIGELAGELDAEVKRMIFEGPAADEFRARMQASSAQCKSAATELLSTAALLETSATQVEAAQRERLRRMEEMRQAELDRQRAAGRSKP
jgi:uncharacterized protein YukE